MYMYKYMGDYVIKLCSLVEERNFTNVSIMKVDELNVLTSTKIIYFFHKIHTNYHTVLLSQYTTSLLLQ